MPRHDKIDYLEFPAKDLVITKTFFTVVFDWSFTDYGPEYTAFDNAGIDGGFYLSDQSISTGRWAWRVGMALARCASPPPRPRPPACAAGRSAIDGAVSLL